MLNDSPAHKILMTGATGFIGKALTKHLVLKNLDLVAAVRKHSTQISPQIQQVVTGDQMPDTDWSTALAGVDVVIHLAGRAHLLKDAAADPLAEYRRANTASTLNLARQAAIAGTKRFIFVSSIKVNGEMTTRKPFTPDEVVTPEDPYGVSKFEAELGLRDIAEKTGMEVVIIRPPLVYGPGAPGNFGLLIRAVARGIPLPLGAIHNKRSLVAVSNLVDLITLCIKHPAAANQTFMASDNEDLSTTELVIRIGKALGYRPRMFPIPQGLLTFALVVLGKGAIAQRLCGSLQVDINKTLTLLNWTPPYKVDEAMLQTAQAFLKQAEAKR